MGTPSWAIPVGCLSAICFVALAFVWWYIPRAYKKGVQADMARVDASKAAAAQRAMELRERGEDEEGDLEAGREPVAAHLKPGFKYTPQAYTAY